MGNVATTGNGQIVREKKEIRPADRMVGILQKMGPEMEKALPRHISPDRMMRIAMTALRATPKLAECSPATFLGSVIQASQLGLEVNTPLGQAYLIPRKNKGNMECTLQIGYQGFMDLARRSGEVAAIYAEAVYEGDLFDYELGLEKSLKHRPSDDDAREEKPLTHVYAVAKLKSGEALFVVLTRGQVEKYRKRGGDRSFSPWSTDYEAMAKKTAVRRLFTWIPRSAEMARAQSVDESTEVGGGVQVNAFDPDVTAALESHGVEVVREPGDDSDIIDGES